MVLRCPDHVIKATPTNISIHPKTWGGVLDKTAEMIEEMNCTSYKQRQLKFNTTNVLQLELREKAGRTVCMQAGWSLLHIQ